MWNAMTALPIIIAPDPELKKASLPVAGIDDGVRGLMDDLLESMRAANGLGLAAPQIGVLKRVIVVLLPPTGDDGEPEPMFLANPEIAWASAETYKGEEGCLSLPEHYADVRRPARVRVRFLDRDGEAVELELEGIAAKCVQHEMDHLDGVLFVDHVSALKRNIILRKLTKWKRQNAA
jgi:peptide deformylase